ncbi:MAG: DUF2828 family protein [Bacteroidales bacterium]|nr:DUF2828 family protein [Candidatus Scybalousia scybalohippi]
MSFADAMRDESKFTRTENGAVALNTTGNALLDLFGSIGSLREADKNRIETLFAEAYREDPLFATKIVFYARDIRGGLGERKTFRTLIKYMANRHPETLRPNLDLIGVFGRYDDMYELIGTPLEEDMWAAMKKQFEEDLHNLVEGKAISLLAKWIKTSDASSKRTREMGILTAHKLGYPVYNFKRIVRKMRQRIGVVESLMSAGKWDEIKYPEVPSRAMMIYRKAFMKHDSVRFEEFIGKAEKGEVKINASTLFPYDIVEKILYKRESSRVLETQWNALPNYVEEGTNALVMADVSGSMSGRPMATSIGLAIYFAERNVGAYHNLFMTFSGRPETVVLKGETLEQKIRNVSKANWDMNTDLKAAFDRVLEIAEDNHIPQEEMPKAIVVVSDMEIDNCGNREWSFYDKMANKFSKAGYVIPNIIFWNVNSRHDVFHADQRRKGVQLASGQSVTVFKQVLQNLGFNPVEAMQNTINSERYDCITVE